MIELVEGNLLEADADALVNTVNTEGVMGKGLALQFKTKFPEMFEEYHRACQAGEVRPGRMHIVERREMFRPRYIINFPTKRQWRFPSRMEDIEAGLMALVGDIERLHIHSIAIPPLGCGNGGLDWNQALPKIQSALGPLPDLPVFVFQPQTTPGAQQQRTVKAAGKRRLSLQRTL